jgi:hypothetical protein
VTRLKAFFGLPVSAVLNKAVGERMNEQLFNHFMEAADAEDGGKS